MLQPSPQPLSQNWDAYLESLCTAYARWWDVYTLTDVVSRKQAEPESAPLLLDFMVQTMPPDKEKEGEGQQTTERLNVLEGLRKYAPEHVLLIGRPGAGGESALAKKLRVQGLIQ